MTCLLLFFFEHNVKIFYFFLAFSMIAISEVINMFKQKESIVCFLKQNFAKIKKVNIETLQTILSHVDLDLKSILLCTILECKLLIGKLSLVNVVHLCSEVDTTKTHLILNHIFGCIKEKTLTFVSSEMDKDAIETIYILMEEKNRDTSIAKLLTYFPQINFLETSSRINDHKIKYPNEIRLQKCEKMDFTKKNNSFV